MGCDIHMVVERCVNGKWVGIDAMHHLTTRKRRHGDLGFAIPLATDRNYERFAKLAGVRGDGPKPNGLPDDISDLTRLEVDYYGDDGHSHGWLPLKDAACLWSATEWRDGKLDPESYEAKFPEAHYFRCEAIDAGGSSNRGRLADYRLVFWFDN